AVRGWAGRREIEMDVIVGALGRAHEGGGTMRRLSGLCAMLVIGLVVVLDPSAWAVSPVGGGGYNVQAHIDLRGLTRANFDAVVTPAAKAQSNVVFYDFADTLCELLAKEVDEWSRSTG